MKNRNSHEAKSITERNYYGKYIRKQDYSPTVDETLPFSGSDESQEDLSEPTAKRSRSIPFQQQFTNHIKEYYISWIIGGILLISVFLMYGSKIDISDTKIHLNILRGDISELKENTRENTKSLHQHDLKLQENKIHIKSLGDDLKRLTTINNNNTKQ